MRSNKIWVAKVSDKFGLLHDFNLSPIFSDIYECQKYIDENLKDIEELLTKAFQRILLINGKICLGGSFIRCYNLRRQAFATGFDF